MFNDKLVCIRETRMKEAHDRRYINSHNYTKDELFLTIADGDFAFSKVIENNVIESVKTRSLAYSFLEEESKKDIVKYYQKHYGYRLNGDDILFGNGVLYWIQLIIHVWSKPGENVLSLAPVYNSFKDIVIDSKRVDLKSKLIFKNNKFSINFEDLEEKMKISKVLIWCSPHNPTGNVWSEEDTKKVLKLAKKYNVIVASDEIWQDMIINGNHALTLKYKKYSSNVIHISSPAKTFNLGGIQMGIAVVEDKNLLSKLREYHISTIHYSSSNHWTSHAIQTAYGSDDAWKWAVKYNNKIKDNYKLLKIFLDNNNIEYSALDATYLLFLNMGSKNTKEEIDRILSKHKIHLGEGISYGEDYKTWARINFAICDKSMKYLILKLEAIFKELK